MKKYEILRDHVLIVEHKRLYRIRALKSFGNVSIGDLGGYIECQDNLSQKGRCWVSDNAIVYGNAIVAGNALVIGNAAVKDEAYVCDNVVISGESIIEGRSIVCGKTEIEGKSYVYGNPYISGKIRIIDSKIHGSVRLNGKKTYKDTDFPCHDQDDLDVLISNKNRRGLGGIHET